ncbi:hypothetical protein Hanom_Chr10g00896061 [Helianthus anomalus]
MLAPPPLNNNLTPSFFMIWLNVSNVFLYLTASPYVIIILLRIVSIGYEATPAPFVINQSSAKLAHKLYCSKIDNKPLPNQLIYVHTHTNIYITKLTCNDPVRRIGLRESYIPKYRPR